MTTGRGCLAISQADVGYRAKAMSVVRFLARMVTSQLGCLKYKGISCKTNQFKTYEAVKMAEQLVQRQLCNIS